MLLRGAVLVSSLVVLVGCDRILGLGDYGDDPLASGGTGGASSTSSSTSSGGAGTGGSGGVAPSGTVLWVSSYDSGGDDEAWSVAATPDGGAVVAGLFAGDDPGCAVAPPGMFLAKFDDAGIREWVRCASVGPGGRPENLAVGPNGHVHVVGRFDVSLVLASTVFASAGDVDGFYIELDTDGSVVQALTFGGLGEDFARSVAVSALGEVVLCGTHSADAFLPGLGNQAGAGGLDLFVARIGAAGLAAPFYAAYLGDQRCHGVSFAEDDSVAITGSFQTRIDLGMQLNTAGEFDMFLGVLSAASTALWGWDNTNPNGQGAWDVATTAGHGWVVGNFLGNLSLPTMDLTNTQTATYDMYVVAFDPSDGTIGFAESFGTAADDYIRAVGIDPSGAGFFAGDYFGGISMFGGDFSGGGARTAFVAKREADLTVGWVKIVDGPGLDRVLDASVGSDAVFATGDSDAEVHVDGLTVTSVTPRDVWLTAIAR